MEKCVVNYVILIKSISLSSAFRIFPKYSVFFFINTIAQLSDKISYCAFFSIAKIF